MNAKMMKEFVEEKSGLTAEYSYAQISQSSATLSFSKEPRFVALSFIDAQAHSERDTVYSANIPYSSKDVRAYLTYPDPERYVIVSFYQTNVRISSAPGTKVCATAFF